MIKWAVIKLLSSCEQNNSTTNKFVCFSPKVLQSKHDALLQRIDELDQECEELRERVMDIEDERDELKNILDETRIQTESLTKTLTEKQVGFRSL